MFSSPPNSSLRQSSMLCLALCAMLALLSACGGDDDDTSSQPAWVTDRQAGQQPGYLYGVGVGRSDDGDVNEALNKAKASARGDISSQIVVTVESEFDRRISEVMIDDKSRVTNRSRDRVVSRSQAVLNNTEVDHQWTGADGTVWVRVRAPESARAEARRQLEIEWRKDDALVFASANYEYNSGNYRAAIDYLETMLTRDRSNQQAQLLMAQSLAALGRNEEAVERYDLVVAINADLTEAYVASRQARKLREDMGQDVNLSKTEKLLRELADPDVRGMWRTQKLQSYFALKSQEIVEALSSHMSTASSGKIAILNQVEDATLAGVLKDFMLSTLEGWLTAKGYDVISSDALVSKLRAQGVRKNWQVDPVELGRSEGAGVVITITGEQLAIARALRVRDGATLGSPQQFLVPQRTSKATGGAPIMMVGGVAVKGDSPEWRLVDWGSTISDAKQARINFRIDRRAFVYALVYSSRGDGESPANFKILYPMKDESALVQAHEAFTLPLKQAYQLEEGPRSERIFVIASEQPIEAFDRFINAQDEDGDVPLAAIEPLSKLVIQSYQQAQANIFDHKRVATEGKSESSPSSLSADIIEGFGRVAYYIKFMHD